MIDVVHLAFSVSISVLNLVPYSSLMTIGNSSASALSEGVGACDLPNM